MEYQIMIPPVLCIVKASLAFGCFLEVIGGRPDHGVTPNAPQLKQFSPFLEKSFRKLFRVKSCLPSPLRIF